jgi:hypothetical protein
VPSSTFSSSITPSSRSSGSPRTRSRHCISRHCIRNMERSPRAWRAAATSRRDAARRARESGTADRAGLVEAGRLRLRPILMTTLCTLAGLAPLAVGFGAGAELQRPLALAVVGGLTISTGVTLLLLPVLLDVLGAVRSGWHPTAPNDPPPRPCEVHHAVPSPPDLR